MEKCFFFPNTGSSLGTYEHHKSCRKIYCALTFFSVGSEFRGKWKADRTKQSTLSCAKKKNNYHNYPPQIIPNWHKHISFSLPNTERCQIMMYTVFSNIMDFILFFFFFAFVVCLLLKLNFHRLLVHYKMLKTKEKTFLLLTGQVWRACDTICPLLFKHDPDST